jgi:phosphate/sulfate permease
VGFGIAAYSAVANDSIQTLGTFIASNRKRPWWLLWLFIGGVFLVTVTYSWVTYGGDVSYQRLAAKGFSTAPSSFSFLQLAAPIVLLVLTRLKMPVSTTFLLLTGFATTASSVGGMLTKSLGGYMLAFVLAIVLWTLVSKPLSRIIARGPAHPGWSLAQWVTTGLLWAVWLMQDAANIAVFLPRALGPLEFVAFAGVIFAGLGILFFMRGEKIQEVVDEKSDVVDVRAATLIDLLFAFILFFFKEFSKMPMSTTWVFIGLLSGRELAMTWMRANGRSLKATFRMITKDLGSVTIGLVVSLLLALAVNEAFRRDVFGSLGL